MEGGDSSKIYQSGIWYVRTHLVGVGKHYPRRILVPSASPTEPSLPCTALAGTSPLHPTLMDHPYPNAPPATQLADTLFPCPSMCITPICNTHMWPLRAPACTPFSPPPRPQPSASPAPRALHRLEHLPLRPLAHHSRVLVARARAGARSRGLAGDIPCTRGPCRATGCATHSCSQGRWASSTRATGTVCGRAWPRHATQSPGSTAC